MKPKDIFLLLVKAVGLFFLYQTAVLLITFCDRILFATTMPTPIITVAVDLLNLFLKLALSIYFLKGAPPFSRMAYPGAEQ